MGSISGQIERCGPVVELLVMASPERVGLIRKLGGEIPHPARVRALIDTGATCSAVDVNVLTSLGLSPTGSTPIHTPTSGTCDEYRDAYDVSLILGDGGEGPRQFVVGVVGSQLARAGITALIGWDVLSSCDLICK